MEESYNGTIIALDTSTAAMAAAITRGDEVLAEIESLAERNHSVHVITHIKALLQETGISNKELDAIVVGSGPGSYTGMRIAVTAAKTLAWAWEKPLTGVSSLEAIAYGALHVGLGLDAGADLAASAPGTHWVLPIMDARRGQVYSACFTSDKGSVWSRRLPDGVRIMQDWVEEIATEAAATGQAEPPVIWLTGDLSLHGDAAHKLQELGRTGGVDVRLLPHVLKGQFLARLGRQRLASGIIENTHTFTPNYTQLTEAEVKLKAKQAGEV
jgi:tRNA threonylcarbamoyladenosine biosynthesis protein TsaB